MTTSSLPAALLAAAEGLYALEAATGLIIGQASRLDRGDFARFTHPGRRHGPPSTGKPRLPHSTRAGSREL